MSWLRNTSAAPWSALIITFALALAGCGVDSTATELSTTDPAIETTDVADADSSVTRVEAGQPDSEPDEPAPQPEIPIPSLPDAPIRTSPLERQAFQSVGGAEPEQAVASPDDASGPQVTRDQPDGTVSSNAVLSDPSLPRFDVPVSPDSPLVTEEDAETADRPDPAAAAVVPSTLPTDKCGPSCEIGGLEPAMDDLAPSDGDNVGDKAQTLISDDSGAVDQTTEPDPADDECPSGSADDCIVVGETEGVADQDPTAVEAEDEATDCEAQPWRRGCDGPVPSPSDYEEQVPAEATGATAGVIVPQEIQDALLSPVD